MRITSLIDVDNTLLDNDRAKVDIARSLIELLGESGAAAFWVAYEEVRADLGVVDIPHTIAHTLGTGVAMSQKVALADLFMRFPFVDYLYEDAFETLTHLGQLGPVVILSDGDPVFQPTKIIRSGLAQAVDGHVLVFRHKEEHLVEIAAAFPADRYVLIDDKPGVIERLSARAHELGAPLETVLVRQGKYAATVPPGRWSGATHTIEHLGDVRSVLGSWEQDLG